MSTRTTTRTSYNVLPLLLTGLFFHLTFIYSVFDCYFTSPVVNGMRHHALSFPADAGQTNKSQPPLADRLVLIVGDGLRADLLYGLGAFNGHVQNLTKNQAEGTVAPYLRNVVLERGAYGISHTRVPTESRPGHVALIGGMYEDVSAVTKVLFTFEYMRHPSTDKPYLSFSRDGKLTQQVDFDSVFNQSSHTFSFGSPDILPMFSRGASPPEKVQTWMYEEVDEDFSKDATTLDDWVLDQLRQLLANSTMDAHLDVTLRNGQVVFFLHLLGLDTTGHSYRPHSKEYMDAIANVDFIVRATEELIEEFYGHDGRTAYVFTADHGMSVVGNHGDGHPDNTRTPLIAWGSGFRRPLPYVEHMSREAAAISDKLFPPPLPPPDSYSSSWNLSHLIRTDVEQADVAAMMAAVLGINWPVHGVGVLPDVKIKPGVQGGLLNFGEGEQAEEMSCRAAQVNAQVITEQYRIKHEQKQRHTLFYKPFPPFASSPGGDHTETVLDSRLSHLNALISIKEYFQARIEASKLVEDGLEGLRYLHTYDRTLLRTIVCFAYIGWAAYASLYVLRPTTSLSTSASATYYRSMLAGVAFGVLGAFGITFWLQKSPWTYFIYISFPVYFWYHVASAVLAAKLSAWVTGKSKMAMLSLCVKGAGVLVVLQAMVAGYTHRFLWSFGFVLIGFIWPAYAFHFSSRPSNRALRKDPNLIAAWFSSCLVTAIFPTLDLDMKESLPTILFGGGCMLAFGAAAAISIARQCPNQGVMKGFGYQILLIGLSMGVTASSVTSLQARRGLPVFNQVAGWVILVLSSLYPFLPYSQSHTPKNVQGAQVNIKILTYFLSFAPWFVLLSISVEGLFYLSYSITLLLWIEVEAFNQRETHLMDYLRPSKGVERSRRPSETLGEYRFQADDLRIALFFLFFVQVGFFGTGNVASISSFYLEPVFRLVVVFRPFLMATLLIFKIVAPYMMLSACFATLNARLRLPPFSLFLVSLAITDGMTMTFFFKVTDTGSWLEIGQSISFFCITSLLLVWSAGLCAAGEAMMGSALKTTSTSSKAVKSKSE